MGCDTPSKLVAGALRSLVVEKKRSIQRRYPGLRSRHLVVFATITTVLLLYIQTLLFSSSKGEQGRVARLANSRARLANLHV